jgi:ribosomal protein S18 acetylase RimI-like enzyme
MTFPDGTQERAGLSEEEVREVLSLVGQCLPVDVNIILEANEGHQFLHYRASALVGVLGLRHDGEACLCVAPGARRKGIGRALIAAADERLARSGIGEMLVECDSSSTEGQAFLHAMLGTVQNAEYRLRLADPKALHASPGKIRLERIGAQDIASFARATAVAFGDPSEARVDEFERKVRTERYRFYLARVGDSGVGGICAGHHGTETHLTSFHTVPEARRRGYGRDLLLQVCRTLIDEGRTDIILEVRTDNEAALGLYRSCGFQVVRRYDFYGRRVVARDGGRVSQK